MNKLPDQKSNTNHHSIDKKPINADYSALTEKIETNHEAPKFKVNDRVTIAKYKNIFNKSYIENWSRSYYPEPDSHIRDKVKVVILDLSNYATKNELDHATSVDTSDLADKKDFYFFENWG